MSQNIAKPPKRTLLVNERLFRRALVVIALAGLVIGLGSWFAGHNDWANWCWAGGTIPVVVGLLVSIVRDFLAGRLGVDAVAFVSMSGVLVLGQNLAGIVVAIMYSGGNLLEDFAVARAERDLRSLIDRAPKVAHRRVALTIEDVPIVQGHDRGRFRCGRARSSPLTDHSSAAVMIDEFAVTGNQSQFPIRRVSWPRSGSLNAGDTFEIRASATAGESTYAGIVRMVSAAQRQIAVHATATATHCCVAAHSCNCWRSVALFW